MIHSSSFAVHENECLLFGRVRRVLSWYAACQSALSLSLALPFISALAILMALAPKPTEHITTPPRSLPSHATLSDKLVQNAQNEMTTATTALVAQQPRMATWQVILPALRPLSSFPPPASADFSVFSRPPSLPRLLCGEQSTRAQCHSLLPFIFVRTFVHPFAFPLVSRPLFSRIYCISADSHSHIASRPAGLQSANRN